MNQEILIPFGLPSAETRTQKTDANDTERGQGAAGEASVGLLPTRPRRRRRRRTAAERGEATHERAIRLGKSGDYLGAARLLLEVVQLRPYDASAWCNLGTSFELAEMRDEAMVPFRTAAGILIETDPEFRDPSDGPLYAIASMGLADGEPALAMKLAEIAVELAPGTAFVHSTLAWQLVRQGLAEDALAPARRAVELDPDSGDAVGTLMSVFIGTGLFLEAQDLGEKSLPRWPGNAEIRFNLGISYLDHGQEQRAAEVFSGMLELNPQDAEAHAFAGVAYAALGWEEDARQAQAAARKYGEGNELVERLTAEIDTLLDDEPGGQTSGSETDVLKLLIAAVLARQAAKQGRP